MKKDNGGDSAPQTEKKIRCQMTITLYEDGTINLQGIPDNIIIAYGLLAFADKMLFLKHQAQQGSQKPRIEIPGMKMPPSPD